MVFELQGIIVLRDCATQKLGIRSRLGIFSWQIFYSGQIKIMYWSTYPPIHSSVIYCTLSAIMSANFVVF